jgi:hypothetical protein
VAARDGEKQWKAKAEQAESAHAAALKELEGLRAQAQQRVDAGQAPTAVDNQVAAAQAAIDKGVDRAKLVVLVVPGGSPEQLQAGEAAALTHLEQNGLKPWDVAEVFRALETWDDDGITEDSELPGLPTKPCEVWTYACGIAFQVACAGLAGGIAREAKVVLYYSWGILSIIWRANNGILGKVPGALISQAQQQHGPPSGTWPAGVVSESDWPDVGRVRIKIQLMSSRHHRSTNWFRNAYFAAMVEA